MNADLCSKLINIAADLVTTTPAGEDLVSHTTPRYVQRRVIKSLDDLRNANCVRAIQLRAIADELRRTAARRTVKETLPASEVKP